MRWASALSERVDPQQALAEAAETVRAELGGAPDLAFMFVSTHYQEHFERMASWADQLLAPAHLIGCSSSGVIGRGKEVEQRDAVALLAARLPGVDVRSFHLSPLAAETDVRLLPEMIGVRPDEDPGFVLLCDPFAEVELLLKAFDQAFPSAAKVGGLAGGSDTGDDVAIFRGGDMVHGGVVGLALSGALRMDTVVAQGCRPIGEPMIITRANNSVIYELNAGRPVDVLQRVFEKLDPRDQELCRHSLFLGIEMSDGHRYGHGDFLIRNLAGVDPEGGAMAVAGHCQDYQVVQFHLRDSRTSAHDLDARLASLARDSAGAAKQGALMFSCIGRGHALYGTANHDSDAFCRHFGSVPLGGFFGNGEIGPVAGTTFLHGYTSALAIFSDR